MRILNIRAMRGPNYWSIRWHKLIVMTLDLEELEEQPTHEIDGFYERLIALFPSMYDHHCSVGSEGGFFERVKAGTWMGHVIEHLALEIQTLAGMEVGFGRTRGYGEPGVYQVVFAYKEEKVGIYAAKAATQIAKALIQDSEIDLAHHIQKMQELRDQEQLGPSTASIIEAAVARGIPWMRLNKYSLCQLGYGANQKRIQSTVTSDTSSIAVEIACDKEDTKHLLHQAEIPVPKGEIIRNIAELKEAINTTGFPLVIKPINGNHGRGITANINSWEEAEIAFETANEISNSVIIEKHIAGEDYRLLVINYKLVAAALRTPAHVIGDGYSTVQQLIDKINEDPRRGNGHEKALTKIKVNEMTLSILEARSFTLETVLLKGEFLKLKDTANLSTGGTATDVTDIVHPSNVVMAERIAKIIGLDICGIDIMTSDISQEITEIGGAVLEVNAGPGFRMHLAPTDGLSRNVAAPVIDMLFPSGAPSRIPIIAVTGTNGKTTTTRLIAHMVKMSGQKVGYTTSDGVYIQNQLMMSGDCTGPASAAFILRDPSVEFAVLECARGGLLRAGLGFHHCDIGIVTNVTTDHLGLGGIHTVEQLARVKGVIPETVFPGGYAILNADDDLVYDMRHNLECKVALFSMDENSERIAAHCKEDGLSAIYENGYVSLCKGAWKIRVMKAVNIPLTFDGKADFMIQNILPVILTGYIRGFSLELIKNSLETFIPSPSQTPGRLNLFQFEDFQVLLDYAHNPAGMNALKNMVLKMEGSPKVGIIAGIGDRRDEDNRKVAAIAAETFDEIIIRQDKNLRGKTGEELIKIMKEGIHSVDPLKPIMIITSEKEAITYAVKNASENSIIVMCSDEVSDALELVKTLKEEEEKEEVVNRSYEFSTIEIPNIYFEK